MFSLELHKTKMIEMVSAYLKNDISDLEIGNWAGQIDDHLNIKAQFLDLDKIPYQVFITTIGLLRFNEKWKHVQRNEIINILDVLLGRADISYSMRLRVPLTCQAPLKPDDLCNLKFDAVHLEAIKKILESKLKNNDLTGDDVSVLQKFTPHKPIVTVLDLISSQIKDEIGHLSPWDERFHTEGTYAIYPDDLVEDEKIFVGRLIRLINCYLGYDSFNIFCLFTAGVPYLSLLL